MGSEAGSEACQEATSANPTAARTEDGGSGENKATGATSPETLNGGTHGFRHNCQEKPIEYLSHFSM